MTTPTNPAPESAGECRFCPHPITDHDPLSGACAVDGCGCGVTFGSAEKMRERFRRDFGPRIARESAGEEDLLPCPFCGSDEASVVSGMGEHWVLCANVECYGSTRMASTEAEAVAAWNRRSTPAAPQPEACCEHPKGHHGLPGANTTRGYCASCPDSRTWHDYVPAPQPGMVTPCPRHPVVIGCSWYDDTHSACEHCGSCLSCQPEPEGMTEAERVEIANLTAEINLAIYNTIPNVTLAQVERVNVRAILTAAKGGRS